MMSKKRYALVGVGSRSRMYSDALADRFAKTCELVALCDNNEGRLRMRADLDNEQYDGYFRDGCVFSAEIDIEDTMNVNVTYRSGAMMSYSLHSFMPWEGYIVSFNGSKGRLEHICQESVYFSGDGSVPGKLNSEGTKIKIYPHFKSGYELELWKSIGGHGGGDPLLLGDLLNSEASEDKYKRAADYRAGAWSILTGTAANHSMKRGQPIHIQELIHNLDEPSYPPMPSAEEPLPLPHVEETMPDWFKKA